MFFKVHLILFVFASVRVVKSKLETLPDELTTRRSLSRCIALASKNHLSNTSSVLMMNLPIEEVSAQRHSAVTLDMLLYKDLFDLYTFSLLINKAISSNESRHMFRAKADIYLIQLRQKNEITKILKYLAALVSWNPTAKFVLMSASNLGDENYEIATYLVEVLWSYKIINAVILLPIANWTDFEVYSWSPFKEGKCGKEFGTVAVIDRCAFGNFTTTAAWFPNRIPNNLKECEVRIRTVIWPPFVNVPTTKVPKTRNQYVFEDGIEINMMNAIAAAANFTVNYTVSDYPEDWGDLGSNGTGSGMMASLLNEDVDVGMGSVGATVMRHKFFDASITYLQEGITFCVPRSVPTLYWKRVASILPLSVYLLCAVCMLTITFLSVRMARLEANECGTYRDYTSNFFNVLRIVTGNPLNVQPRSTKVRCLIMLWVIFALNLNITYETSLVSVMTSNSHQQELHTVDELVKSNYELYILPSARRFFRDSSQSTRDIRRKLITCRQMETCLARVAHRRDIAMFTPRLYYYYVRNVYVGANGVPLIYYFRENVVTYPIEMLMRKNFILKDRINALLSRIVAAGLIPHWVKRTFNDKHLGVTKVNFQRHASMSMEQLRFVFGIYSMLISVAILVFLIEMLTYKYLPRWR